MKKLVKIAFILSLLLMAGQNVFAQSSDSTRVIRKNDKTFNDRRRSEADKNDRKGPDNNKPGDVDNTQQKNRPLINQEPVKRINGARPDLSQMRGARPPAIIRPSGSLIPRGVGRPGGALRPGGR